MELAELGRRRFEALGGDEIDLQDLGFFLHGWEDQEIERES